ncbi:MAG: PAS domain-containing protein [Kouleothrix sp.]
MFRLAADAVDAGMVIVDREREVRYLNQQAEQLLDVSADLPSRQGLIALVRDYQADALVQDVLRDGEPRELVLQPPQKRAYPAPARQTH